MLKKPAILSFEYSKNRNLLERVLSYINHNDITAISITGFPSIKFLKKINAHFISIDIDFSEQLTEKELKLIESYDDYSSQLRLIVKDEVEVKNIEEDLKKIKTNYSGNKILFYKISIPVFDKKYLLEIIKKSRKHAFIPSFLPLDNDVCAFRKEEFISFLLGFREEIKNKKILIDAPDVLSRIFQEEYFCPAINPMVHIDKEGNFGFCKFSSHFVGNIMESGLEELWKKRNDFIRKMLERKQKGACLILPNKNYVFFSSVYDKLSEENPILDDYTTFIKNRFKDNNIKILDAACGTGALIKRMKEKYKNIEGIDKSKEMIRIAEKKTGTKIFHGDIAEFNLKRKYNLILCTFDSLNYILDQNLLRKAIINFYNHLEREGVLIFDVNTDKKFKEHRNRVKKQKLNNSFIKTISTYKAPIWKLTIKSKEWEEVHYERFYSIEFLNDLLKESGFSNVESKECINGKNKYQGRCFFTANK